MNMIGWGYGMMTWLGMMLIPAAIVIVFLFIIVKLIMNNNSKNVNESDSAMKILNERFARGEINEEEYKEKKSLLLK